MSNDVIPPYIHDIKSVHLTKAGQAAVSAFSREILMLADQMLLKKKGVINNRIGYFFKLCHTLCRERNTSPDYAASAALHKLLGTDEGMPLQVSNNKKNSHSSLIAQGARSFEGQAQKGEIETFLTNPIISKPSSGTPRQAIKELAPEEAKQRRESFIKDPEAIAGIDRLAKLLGSSQAGQYFTKVLDNLKYDATKDSDQI